MFLLLTLKSKCRLEYNITQKNASKEDKISFLDANKPVWEFLFESHDAKNNLNNTGTDPLSLSLKLNEGKLTPHPSRTGKVISCARKDYCIDTSFDPDSEVGKCMKYVKILSFVS